MSNLRYTHLQGNPLSEPIPHSLAKLSLTLELMNNKFSGEIPSSNDSCSNLRVILLKGNDLERSIPIFMCQLRHMSISDLSHNSLSREIIYLHA